LDLENDQIEDRSRLMLVMDTLNLRFDKVHLASAGLAGNQRTWPLRQERRTPGYTTCWADIPIERA
jgi:DNA polymerase V